MKITDEKLTIKKNQLIAQNIYELILTNKKKVTIKPGQFINIKINDTLEPFLRRPFSVADYNDDEITIIYQVVGKGTQELSEKNEGEILDVLVNLGNGWPRLKNKIALLIGGGVGVAPLYAQAKALKKQGTAVINILGFRSKACSFYVDKFEKLGDTIVCTDDNSHGFGGNVINYLEKYDIEFDEFFACGPPIVLKLLTEKLQHKNGYVSLESRMGCGFGACMGCTCQTKNGLTGDLTPQRICMEGPVFKAREVFYEK